jgi:hypothetical protein
VKFNLLEPVVLTKDIKKHGLKKGDLGTVVEVYGKHDYEVEFVTAGGRTQALISLHEQDLRPVAQRDIVAVRSLRAVA